MISNVKELPRTFQKDIQRAVEILREEGCTEISLFGSAVEGWRHKNLDVGLAVRGCPKDRFFHALGRLLMTLNRSVNLVDLDLQNDQTEYLLKHGELLRIG